MPRPSKLPALRKHLLGRGYSLATINVYVWAAAATLDAVLALSDENLRAFFQTFEPAKRATYRAAWRALCEQRRETDGVDTPRGDPLPPDASAEAVAAVPALVAQTARALRAQEVSGRKALTLLVGDVRRFGEQAVVDLHTGTYAMLATAQVDALLAWGYPDGDAQPGDPLFSTPGSRQPLPYGVLLSALQRYV
jgi:hypothetical protein